MYNYDVSYDVIENGTTRNEESSDINLIRKFNVGIYNDQD